MTLQDIRVAELAGEAPEYVEGLRRFRLSRYEHNKQEEMRREEKRKQIAQEKAAQKLREAEEKIAAAETVIRESGILNNDRLEIPRADSSCQEVSIILHLCQKYGIQVPLRTKGWINQALISVRFENGKCTSGRYLKSHTGSGVVFRYLNELANKVNVPVNN